MRPTRQHSSFLAENKDVPYGLQALEPGLIAFQLPLLLFHLCVGVVCRVSLLLSRRVLPTATNATPTYLGLEHPLLRVECRVLLLQDLEGLAERGQVFRRHDAVEGGRESRERGQERVVRAKAQFDSACLALRQRLGDV